MININVKSINNIIINDIIIINIINDINNDNDINDINDNNVKCINNNDDINIVMILLMK